MKKYLITISALLLGAGMAMADKTPAFPGAEGHGRYVTGGRNGKIIHVTNLNDSGTGSLRAALTAKGDRIVVFDVGGTIHLTKELNISNGNVTILGQTAPGGGITVADYTVTFAADNVICRFVRFRHGTDKSIDDGADASWGRNRHNIILDHCSFSWSIDEVASFYDNENFTMQWCTIGEGLNNAGHGKGAHGYGGIWGGKGASFHHNLLIHNNNRNPRLNGARFNWTNYEAGSPREGLTAIESEEVDLRNCVMYNWGNGNGAYGGTMGSHNIVNNYYKPGPATKNRTRVFQCSKNTEKDANDHGLPVGEFGKFFISGNYMDNTSVAEADRANYDWKGVIYDSGGSRAKVEMAEPCDFGDVTTHTAQNAFDKVTAYAGASYYRDAVDARYADEARTGTATYTGSVSKQPGILDVNADFGGFPELPAGTPIVDSDKDGIPDEWELLNGLNPNDASDALKFTVDPRGWYNNLEVYANQLVEHIVRGGNSDAISAVDEYYPSAQSGIGNITTGGGDVERIEYYDLNGIRLSEPAEGITIRRTVYTSGRVVADKIIK